MSEADEGRPRGHSARDNSVFSKATQADEGGWSALTREPLLTPQEEKELATEAHAGDIEARRKLIEANMRLVISIARRYYCPGIPFDDLVQEGAIGLMRACQRFDPERGYRFSTYATHWIRQAICRAIDAAGRAIRVPSYVSENVRKIERCRLELARELGHDPPLDMIAQRSGIPRERVVAYLQATQDPMSLEALAGREERSNLCGAVAHDSARDPEDCALESEFRREVRTILEGLTERERDVMLLRFGFDNDQQKPLQEIGSELGISRERVRQIEIAALRRLRAAARRRRLQEFLAH